MSPRHYKYGIGDEVRIHGKIPAWVRGYVSRGSRKYEGEERMKASFDALKPLYEVITQGGRYMASENQMEDAK